jgi:siroheme synthase (precorrin-2 oxidase/ferrochelatase)
MMVAYQLTGKHVLVVGGGKEAANRTFFALEAGALVTVVAPSTSIHPAVKSRIDRGFLHYHDRCFCSSDLSTANPNRSSLSTNYTVWDVDMVLSCIDDPIESRRYIVIII